MPDTDASSIAQTRIAQTRAARPSAATLAATPLIDSDHPAVRAFAAAHAVGADDRARAVALYGAVRDGVRYNPYRADLSPAGMTANTVLAQGFGWCVPKATLLAAACQAAAIPARLGVADVRNHHSTARMRSSMETDVFYWPGYTEIWINGAWRKATPAFNLSLCQKFGLLPLDQILVDFRHHYPKWMANLAQQNSADFMAEVALETAALPAACPAPARVKPA